MSGLGSKGTRSRMGGDALFLKTEIATEKEGKATPKAQRAKLEQAIKPVQKAVARHIKFDPEMIERFEAMQEAAIEKGLKKPQFAHTVRIALDNYLKEVGF